MMASIGLQKPSTTPRTVHGTSSHSVVIEDRNAELGEIEKAKVPRGYGKCIDYGGGLPGQADPKHGTGQE